MPFTAGEFPGLLSVDLCCGDQLVTELVHMCCQIHGASMAPYWHLVNTILAHMRAAVMRDEVRLLPYRR